MHRKHVTCGGVFVHKVPDSHTKHTTFGDFLIESGEQPKNIRYITYKCPACLTHSSATVSLLHGYLERFFRISYSFRQPQEALRSCSVTEIRHREPQILPWRRKRARLASWALRSSILKMARTHHRQRQTPRSRIRTKALGRIQGHPTKRTAARKAREHMIRWKRVSKMRSCTDVQKTGAGKRVG